jgi:hypothetical protein
MAQYKIQNLTTSEYMVKGVSKSFTNTKGSTWGSYPTEAVRHCKENKIPIKLIKFELKEVGWELFE